MHTVPKNTFLCHYSECEDGNTSNQKSNIEFTGTSENIPTYPANDSTSSSPIANNEQCGKCSCGSQQSGCGLLSGSIFGLCDSHSGGSFRYIWTIHTSNANRLGGFWYRYDAKVLLNILVLLYDECWHSPYIANSIMTFETMLSMFYMMYTSINLSASIYE